MKSIRSTLTLAVLALFAAQGALAQAAADQTKKSSMPECGEMSKAEAAGEKSTLKRADVKKDATAAKLECGDMSKAAPASGKSNVKRADVKKDAAAANKAGTIEKGDAPAK